MKFDPLVETGMDSKNVAKRGDHQVHRERGGTESTRKAHVVERQLPVIERQQSREEDGIDLSEKILDPYMNVSGIRSP